LTVFRLITMERLFDRQVDGASARERPGHIAGGAPEHVREIDAVGHQAALVDVFPQLVDRRQALLRREVDDAAHRREVWPTLRSEDRLHPVPYHGCRYHVDVQRGVDDSGNGIPAVLGLARYSVVNADLTVNLLRRPLESPELRDMTRRFRVGTALALPVFALEMGGHAFDIRHLIAQQRSNWVQLLLGTPVVLWAGWPFFVRALASVKHCSLNMFSLIALGTGAAWLYSIVGTVAPQWFPAALRLADGAVAIYF
jgi:hypothetical protein